MFMQALPLLEGLPVWVDVRLCTFKAEMVWKIAQFCNTKQILKSVSNANNLPIHILCLDNHRIHR